MIYRESKRIILKSLNDFYDVNVLFLDYINKFQNNKKFYFIFIVKQS